MPNLTIYDPAMCCPTGMCGVSIDPEIIRVATALHSLRRNGVEVHRYNLALNPDAFVNNTVVNELLNRMGAEELPFTVLNDVVVLTKRYPSNEEIAGFLGLPVSVFNNLPKALNVLPR
jgi:hypothetical protein